MTFWGFGCHGLDNRGWGNAAVVVGGVSRWKSIQEVYQNGSYLSAKKRQRSKDTGSASAWPLPTGARFWLVAAPEAVPADPLMPRLTA